MENVKLIFQDQEETKQFQCFATISNKIYIEIIDIEAKHDYNFQCILINKQTAVRLVRELKKQIGFLESEVKND